jgi:hypothetical protein
MCVGINAYDVTIMIHALREGKRGRVLGLSGPLRLASSPGSADSGMATPWGRFLQDRRFEHPTSFPSPQLQVVS